MLNQLSISELIDRSANIIYQSEANELNKLIAAEEYHPLASYLQLNGIYEDRALIVRDDEKRLNLYRLIISFVKTQPKSSVMKTLRYRANRLFERTPILLAENDTLRQKLSELPSEYLELVRPILFSDKFLELRAFWHHQDISTFTHSLEVSYRAYQTAKRKGLDFKSAAIGGLLHDYYLYDWHFCELNVSSGEGIGFFDLHFFSHGFVAARRAERDFPGFVDSKVRNIISSHILPASFLKRRPLYERKARFKESSIVRWCDFVSSLGILRHPLKNIGFDRSKSAIEL